HSLAPALSYPEAADVGNFRLSHTARTAVKMPSRTNHSAKNPRHSRAKLFHLKKSSATTREISNAGACVDSSAPREALQIDPPCLRKTLGLVGFHVVHKTKNRPQWIWTSFEHKDNVPEQSQIDAFRKDTDSNKKPPKFNFYTLS